MTKVLDGKSAIIYGGGGGIGGGVARTFAREGAHVFLVGRTKEPLDQVAAEITAAGGAAEVAVLDVLDESAVDAHVRDVVERTGRVDVSFNLINAAMSRACPWWRCRPTTCCGRWTPGCEAASSPHERRVAR